MQNAILISTFLHYSEAISASKTAIAPITPIKLFIMLIGKWFSLNAVSLYTLILVFYI